jgi:exosortase A-associated hydrolase 1
MTIAPERPMTFDCSGDTLVGVLHTPRLARNVGVLFVVGGPQYRVGSHRQFVLMARSLAASGYPILRFDHRGMGDSSGSTRSFEDVSADISAAVDALMASHPGLVGVVIWGLCDAASAALMYCTSDSRLCGLVLVNPWVRTEAGEAGSYLRHYYIQRLLQRTFWRNVFAGGANPVKSVRDFVTTLRVARGTGKCSPACSPTEFIDRMLAGLIGFRQPVLTLISDRDLTAQAFMDLAAAEPRWRAALDSSRVQIARLTDSDHTFSTRASLNRATEICIGWLARLPRTFL